VAVLLSKLIFFNLVMGDGGRSRGKF